MKDPIKIQGSGILAQEIILSALQEYRKKCNDNGNHFRADAVNDVINRIEF